MLWQGPPRLEEDLQGASIFRGPLHAAKNSSELTLELASAAFESTVLAWSYLFIPRVWHCDALIKSVTKLC